MSEGKGPGAFLASTARRILAAAALIALDPFGLGAVTEQASTEVFTKLISPWYPAVERDRIVIVMIDEKDLPLAASECEPLADCNSNTWPISFAEHGALLSSIVGDDPDGYPAAVFVDILFNNPHLDDPTFGDLAAVAARGGAERAAPYPPIIFATEANQLFDMSSPRVAPAPGAPSLLEDAKGALTAHVSWTGDGYPLSVDNDGVKEPTAAAAIYSLVRGQSLGADAAPMMPVWGYEPIKGSHYIDRRLGDDKEAACPSAATIQARAATAAGVAFSGAFANVFKSARARWEIPQPCSFHAEIAAKDLLPSGFDSEFRFRETLKDSIVIVAARIAGIPDNVVSPVHGMLPGGYLHAMAIDNLLVLGDRYFRTAPTRKILGLPLSGVFELAILLSGVLAGGAIAASRNAGWRTKTAASLAVAGVALGFLSAGVAVEHSAAINWLGALTIAIGNILQAGPGAAARRHHKEVL